MSETNLLVPEKVVENDWFTSTLVRQPDGRLLCHIDYKKWSPTAKKKTRELMDTFNEPLYVFVHGRQHLKYVSAVGFQPTGRWITCDFPGKEDMLFPEAMYVSKKAENFYLSVYKEEQEAFLPFSAVDGYGKIQAIEEALKKEEQVKWETKHFFSDGVYTRETFVPAGTMLTGYRHKQRTVSVLAKGIISVMGVDELGYATDFGTLEGPLTFITEPGIKKIGLAHEDTTFINSFSLNGIPEDLCKEDRIEELEEFIFSKD